MNPSIPDYESGQYDDKSHFEKNGKPEINNLLWMFLPPSTTLQRADEIGIEIYRLINNEWNKR